MRIEIVKPEVLAAGYFLPVGEYDAMKDWNTEGFRLWDGYTAHIVKNYDYRSALASGAIKEVDNGTD